MPRRHVTVDKPWEPSEQQAQAIKLLATCRTWDATAQAVGVSIRTIPNWLAIPEFRALVADEAARFDQYLEQDITGSLSEMFAVWRQFLRGEIAASDRRIPAIRPTIIKYIERFYAVGETVPAAPAASASVTVINGQGVRI